jgi:hypothetical protein
MPKEHAEALIGYFRKRASETPDAKVWQLGQDTANEWLRLITASTVSQIEVANLIAIVDENKYMGSGWFDLTLGVSHWAKSEGFSVPYPFWPHKMPQNGESFKSK